MLTKISIKNYRVFRDFSLDFQSGMNIVVGNNDTGKSTLLEAIGIGLTGRVMGRPLTQELTPYHFHQDAAAEYVAALQAGQKPPPPEIIIDLYLASGDDDSTPLRGTNNIDNVNTSGIRVKVSLDPEYADEYKEYISDPTRVRVIPVEYYRVEWLGFSGSGITQRSVPATASLIDATRIRLQSGADYYLQGIISSNLEPRERIEMARSYRSLRETFSDNPFMSEINAKLGGAPGDLTSRSLSLSIDISQSSAWESNLVPHLDSLPFAFAGRGEQSSLKILLALARRLEDAHIMLVEEPENHLAFGRLNWLVNNISSKCDGKQVIVTTHSSFVLNKLGLSDVILLSSERGMRLTDLAGTTQDYFKKLSGYDTLRVILADRVILVEGPSDELVVQRAYQDSHGGKLPIEVGVDVVNVRGLSFNRYLDIAETLGIPTAVVTDNDGKDPAEVERRYQRDGAPNIHIHVGQDASRTTLEPQLLVANNRDRLNAIFDTTHSTDEELLAYMKSNKTTCALAIFESTETINMPGYIVDAVSH